MFKMFAFKYFWIFVLQYFELEIIFCAKTNSLINAIMFNSYLILGYYINIPAYVCMSYVSFQQHLSFANIERMRAWCFI